MKDLSLWQSPVRSHPPVDFPFRLIRTRPSPHPSAMGSASDVAESVQEFQQIMARCQPQLEERARFLCRGRDPSDAKDLLQDTYERALRAFHTYDRNAPPLPWLASILVRRFLDLCRHDKRHPHQELNENLDVASEETGPTEVWAGYTLEDVWRAVERLPEESRTVVRMKDMEGLSYARIGERLGISPVTVGTRLFRARKRLKDLLLEQVGSGGVK